MSKTKKKQRKTTPPANVPNGALLEKPEYVIGKGMVGHISYTNEYQKPASKVYYFLTNKDVQDKLSALDGAVADRETIVKWRLDDCRVFDKHVIPAAADAYKHILQNANILTSVGAQYPHNAEWATADTIDISAITDPNSDIIRLAKDALTENNLSNVVKFGSKYFKIKYDEYLTYLVHQDDSAHGDNVQYTVTALLKYIPFRTETIEVPLICARILSSVTKLEDGTYAPAMTILAFLSADDMLPYVKQYTKRLGQFAADLWRSPLVESLLGGQSMFQEMRVLGDTIEDDSPINSKAHFYFQLLLQCTSSIIVAKSMILNDMSKNKRKITQQQPAESSSVESVNFEIVSVDKIRYITKYIGGKEEEGYTPAVHRNIDKDSINYTAIAWDRVQHTRRLKSGRVITVKGSTCRRNPEKLRNVDIPKVVTVEKHKDVTTYIVQENE